MVDAEPAGKPMIQARLVKSFSGARESAGFILNVDFSTSSGVTVLFGPSGSGKSLTLECIAGFVRPEEGRILADDEILFDAKANVCLPPQKRRCGYVFQNYALFPHMTLRQNLLFAADRLPRLERHRRVAEVLEQFRLTDVSGRKPRELSGGQRQRCSIARALIAKPRLLLLDEPARGLDAPLRAELYEGIRQIRSQFETPVILVTHSLEECFALGEEMLILRDGRIIQAGTPGGICQKPETVEVARLLGIFNVLPVEIKSLDPSRNVSVLRYGDFDLTGPYFPGRFKGDRVSLVVSPQQLAATPRMGSSGANQIVANLLRAFDTPGGVRLEFAGDLAVEVARDAYHGAEKEWLVTFPVHAMRVL